MTAVVHVSAPSPSFLIHRSLSNSRLTCSRTVRSSSNGPSLVASIEQLAICDTRRRGYMGGQGGREQNASVCVIYKNGDASSGRQRRRSGSAMGHHSTALREIASPESNGVRPTRDGKTEIASIRAPRRVCGTTAVDPVSRCAPGIPVSTARRSAAAAERASASARSTTRLSCAQDQRDVAAASAGAGDGVFAAAAAVRGTAAAG